MTTWAKGCLAEKSLWLPPSNITVSSRRKRFLIGNTSLYGATGGEGVFLWDGWRAFCCSATVGARTSRH